MSRGCGAAVPVEVRGRRDERPAHRAQPARAQRRIAGAGDADRDVEAAGHDVDDVIGEHEVDVDARIAFEKRGQHRRQVAHPERHRRIHAHEAVWFERCADASLSISSASASSRIARSQQFASRRERQLARRAAAASRRGVFEARDGLRHRRLRGRRAGRRLSRTLRLATRAKMAQASRSGRCCMVGIWQGSGTDAAHRESGRAMQGILIRPGEKSLWNLIYFRWAPAC